MWKSYKGDDSDWDKVPGVNLSFFQSLAWAQYKSDSGWEYLHFVWHDELKNESFGVQVLVKKKLFVSIAWIPGCHPDFFNTNNKDFYKLLKSVIGTCFTYCRINITHDKDQCRTLILKGSTWFKPLKLLNSGQSMILEIKSDVELMRSGLTKNWRHNLNRSEKHEITTEQWYNPSAHEMREIYEEMEGFKGIAKQFSLEQIESIIKAFGENLVLYRCLDKDGKLIAFRGIGTHGNQCTDFFAAASIDARKVYATYKLFWAIVEYCVNNDILYYDLGGIDMVNNVGVYNFKKGTGAKHVEYMGEWEESTPSFFRYIINKVLKHIGGV